MSLLSVIIPVWNDNELLPQCLTALQAQEHRQIEVIVVDDGSDSPVVLPAWSDARLIRIEHEGAPVARNIGAGESRGHCLYFCDADFVVSPHGLAACVRTLDACPQFGFAYGHFFETYDDGTRLVRSCEPWDRRRIFYGSCLPNPAPVLRRDVFPGFDPGLRRFQDWDMYLNIVKSGVDGVYVGREMAVTRYRLTGISGANDPDDALDVIRAKHPDIVCKGFRRRRA